MHDLQRLLEMLQSPNSSKRYDACEELRVAPWIPAEAIAALSTATEDTDRAVADAARRALDLHMPPPRAPNRIESPPLRAQPIEMKELASQPMMIAAYAPFPLSAEVFLLDPANKEFVEGQSHRIAAHSVMTYLMTVLALLTTFPCILSWTTDPNNWILLILPGITGLAVIGLVIGELRHRRLMREGHLIKGEIVECSSSLETDDGKYFAITLRYAFVTPQGRTLHITEGLTKTPKAHKGLSLPQPTTPVVVLYAHDRLFKLL